MNTFITYHSTNAPADEAWICYINGWKVKFTAPTEQEAKDKAEALWTKERARMAQEQPVSDWLDDAGSDIKVAAGVAGRGHANTGKVWMYSAAQDKFARVALTEISMYESNGYVRKGPRSK